MKVVERVKGSEREARLDHWTFPSFSHEYVKSGPSCWKLVEFRVGGGGKEAMLDW